MAKEPLPRDETYANPGCSRSTHDLAAIALNTAGQEVGGKRSGAVALGGIALLACANITNEYTLLVPMRRMVPVERSGGLDELRAGMWSAR